MIRKLWSGLGVVWWLVTPQKLRCPLCAQPTKAAHLTGHMWLDHADGT